MRSLRQTRSRLTRVLHLLLALAIVIQLSLSLTMAPPRAGKGGDLLFELHEKTGLVTLGLLIAFWAWSLVRTGETRAAVLLPWFSSDRRRLFFSDLLTQARALRGGTLPESDDAPFASGVHGLGLLIASLMAITGALGYFVPQARFLLGVHETAAPVMWAYLIGHAGMALVHQVMGRAVLTRMFSLIGR